MGLVFRPYINQIQHEVSCVYRFFHPEGFMEYNFVHEKGTKHAELRLIITGYIRRLEFVTFKKHHTMKKTIILLAGCLIWGMAFAQQTPGTNTTERAAKRAQQKQAKKFQNDKRYSSLVNSHQARVLRRRQAKANASGGKG